MSTDDDDDEIPLIVDDFQPEPAFLLSSFDGKSAKIVEGTTPRRTGQGFRFQPRSIARKQTFASVLYKHPSLRLIYIYRSIRLEFEVEAAPTNDSSSSRNIRYISDQYNSCLDEAFEQHLEALCKTVCSKEKENSLYATVSKLLGELQKLNISPKLRALPYQHHVSRLMANRKTAWDLPLFLMRCAAASGKSSKLCTPFPPTANSNQPPSFTLCYIRDRLLEHLQNTARKTNIRPTTDEQAVLEFLSSLPWTENAQISCHDKPYISSSSSSSKNSNTNTNNAKSIKLTLQLHRDALPTFQKETNDRGTVKAYHGTSIESAWSIVNYGLRQHPSLQKNGAMLGPGVYLSSNYDVAYFFATQNGSAKYLPKDIWKSSTSFWRLFESKTTKVDRVRDVMEEAQKNGLDLLCYVVIECLIAKPAPSSREDNHRSEHANNKKVKQDDTYFVVKSPYDVHMEQIHLTFEFHKRPRLWKWTIVSITIALILWKASLLLRATRTNTLPIHTEL